MPYIKENERVRVKSNCDGAPEYLWGKQVVVEHIAPRLGGERKQDGSYQRSSPEDEYFLVRCDGVDESFPVLGSCLEHVVAKFHKYDKVKVRPDCEGACAGGCEHLKGKGLIVQSSKELVNMGGPGNTEVKTGVFLYHVLCDDTGLPDGVLESCLELIQ